jgi:hypothetical protein
LRSAALPAWKKQAFCPFAQQIVPGADQFFEYLGKRAAIGEASGVHLGLGGLGEHRPGETARAQRAIRKNAKGIGQPRRRRAVGLRHGGDNIDLMLRVERQGLGEQLALGRE